MLGKRRLPLLAALLVTAAVVVGLLVSNATAGGDPSSTVVWDGNGLSDGVGGSQCDTTDSDQLAPVPAGQKGWLFVLNQIDGSSADWRLDVDFGGSPDQSNLVPVDTTNNGAKWAVYSAAGATLNGATAHATGSGGTSTGNLVVSHCFGSGAATPTVVTEIHLDPGHSGVTEVALGDKVHDSATVSGPPTLGNPTGSVDFKFFSGPCGEDGDQIGATSTVALVNGVADPSAASASLAAGSYHYTAHYNSDNTAKWTSGDAPCEPLTVDKAQLRIVTQIHDASHGDVGGATHVPLGTVVHDTATVSGAVDGFPIGAVSFTLNGSGVASDPAADGAATARSVDSAPLAAGSYTYNASVAGGDNYVGATSDDEPLTVDKAQLRIVTQIHNAGHQDITNTNVPAGTVVHDTATVAGAVAGFDIGDVSFTLNGNPVANGAAESGSTARTVDSAPLTPGSYVYHATVAGNDNYLGATSDPELLSVFTFGKTMGFWGNNNGQAALPANPNVTLGTVSGTTCSIIVNTKAISKIILPNTKNGVSILTNCTTSGSRDPGINTDSLNTLLAQTLALSFNNLYIQGYTGQTIGGMNCTPVGSLASASTVQATRDYANGLIANARLGSPTVTQSQIGALNTLLGCLNRES